MSTAPAHQPQPLSPELRTRLQADLAFQQETGTAWVLLAACIGLLATAYFAWLGLYQANAAPTVIPMCVAALLGVAGIVAAVIARRRRTEALRAVLADGQVTVVEGRLDTADILPQGGALGARPRVYAVDGAVHAVLEESPSSDEQLGFVPRQVTGPPAGTRVRLVFSAVRPGHLLQVAYPDLDALPASEAPMQARDWTGLMARPRAVLRAAAWLCGAMLLGLVVLAFLPAVSRGFNVWLGSGMVLTALWAVWQCLPPLRMWGRRRLVTRLEVSGPVQEVMQARERASRQGADTATFVRVGGAWYRLDEAHAMATLQPGAPLPGGVALAYAVLGERRLALRQVATRGNAG
jgi:4-amino-4-deoxy-L-arabinose transferase-like glycosyltransferase